MIVLIFYHFALLMKRILFYAANSAGEAEVSPKGMRIILFYAASSAGEAKVSPKRMKIIFF